MGTGLHAQHTYGEHPLPAFGYAPFQELPLTAIFPQSWLKGFLVTQKNGLTGSIRAAGFPYNSIGWKGEVALPPGYPDFKLWWPYEQTAYWIDGALRCGYLLNDRALIDSARSQLMYVLNNPAKGGILGPAHLNKNRWPHAILFRAMMAEYYANGRMDVINALVKHFLASRDDYSEGRNVVNVETMCWLYGVTGRKDMLQLAIRSYETYNSGANSDETVNALLSDEIPSDHGVTFLEIVKIPAILYMYTGTQKYLSAALHGFDKLETYHMLADGVPSSSEHFNGKESDNVHETCDISDYIWSAGYMLMITGDAKWGDRIEKACYNAGMGAVTKDFRTHQYYSGPNQILADQNSSRWNCKEPWYDQSRPRMAYQPWHDTECCTGNVNRFLPGLIARMWLREKSGGVVAAMYAPSQVAVLVGKAQRKFVITEETSYPFDGNVRFVFQSDDSSGVVFPFFIRIPEWSSETAITVDGVILKEKITPGSFFRLTRKFRAGTTVTVNFGIAVRLQSFAGNGIALLRGPLLFSLPVPAQTTIVKGDSVLVPGFQRLAIEPVGKFNYALDSDDELRDAEVVKNAMSENPWQIQTTPVRIRVPASEISGWSLKGGYTPGLPTQYNKLKDTTLTLVPTGATTLRISIFPDLRKCSRLSSLQSIQSR